MTSRSGTAEQHGWHERPFEVCQQLLAQGVQVRFICTNAVHCLCSSMINTPSGAGSRLRGTVQSASGTTGVSRAAVLRGTPNRVRQDRPAPALSKASSDSSTPHADDAASTFADKDAAASSTTCSSSRQGVEKPLPATAAHSTMTEATDDSIVAHNPPAFLEPCHDSPGALHKRTGSTGSANSSASGLATSASAASARSQTRQAKVEGKGRI